VTPSVTRQTPGPSITRLIQGDEPGLRADRPAVVQFSIGADASAPIRIIISLVALAIIVAAVVISKPGGHRPDGRPSEVGQRLVSRSILGPVAHRVAGRGVWRRGIVAFRH